MEDYLNHIQIIPENIRDGMVAYIEDGVVPGSFLSAVLENNLCKSFLTADYANKPRLLDIVTYLYNYVPSLCWGSKEKVDLWCEQHGLNGRKEKKNV